MGGALQVESTRDRRESGDPLRSRFVAGQQSGKSATIRLPTGVNTGRVDAVRVEEFVKELHRKFHVVNAMRVRIALPLKLSAVALRRLSASETRKGRLEQYLHAFWINRNTFEPKRSIGKL